MNQALEYIKYRLKAKGRHGIHSPFVYNLLDECFKIRLSGIEKATISQLYSKLSHDKRIISIEDHGVGSKKLGAKRKISTIIKTSSSKGKYGRLLYQLARYTKPKQMLELGTSLGLGTMHLYLGAPDATLTTVEGCPETYRIAGEHLPKTIHRTRSTFDDYLNELDTDAPKFDLVFIDGHHDGKALLKYLNQLESFTHNDTLFVLDDIRWSPSMKKAWIQLVKDSDYHLTIDLFRVGIIARRSQQEKEHFTLKISLKGSR